MYIYLWVWIWIFTTRHPIYKLIQIQCFQFFEIQLDPMVLYLILNSVSWLVCLFVDLFVFFKVGNMILDLDWIELGLWTWRMNHVLNINNTFNILYSSHVQYCMYSHELNWIELNSELNWWWMMDDGVLSLIRLLPFFLLQTYLLLTFLSSWTSKNICWVDSKGVNPFDGWVRRPTLPPVVH